MEESLQLFKDLWEKHSWEKKTYHLIPGRASKTAQYIYTINHSEGLHHCRHCINYIPIHHTTVSEQGQPERWEKPFKTHLEINLHTLPASESAGSLWSAIKWPDLKYIIMCLVQICPLQKKYFLLVFGF